MTPDLELDELLGTTVNGKYRIEGLIGRGGMGAVYEATNLAIGKHVALKFLYRDAARDLDAVTRFQREAEAASAVESAHIVQIFDSGTTDDGLPFLVMELLRGEDLRCRMRRERHLDLAEVVYIGGQVCRALRRAHEAGIVHRDLKPDNVFLCQRDDDDAFVKLVDFGISKVSRKTVTVDTLTRRGMVLGTAFYMAPEQAQAARDVDGRADIFSLGSILFEALAARPPHTGTVYEAILIDICTKTAPNVRDFAPDVPEALATVIARTLEKEREARYQSAQDLFEALAAAVPGILPATPGRSPLTKTELRMSSPGLLRASAAGAPGQSPSDVIPTVEGTVDSLAPPRRRSRQLQAAFAVLVTVLATAATFALMSNRSTHGMGTLTPETAHPLLLSSPSAQEADPRSTEVAPSGPSGPAADSSVAALPKEPPVVPSGKVSAGAPRSGRPQGAEDARIVGTPAVSPAAGAANVAGALISAGAKTVGPVTSGKHGLPLDRTPTPTLGLATEP